MIITCYIQQKAIGENRCSEVPNLLHKLDSEKDADLHTAVLFAACSCGNPEITSVIAKEHSLFDFSSRFSVTKTYPLHEAARKHDTMFFKLLAQDPAFKNRYTSNPKFVSMIDGEGNTLLHIAANEQEVHIASFSLEFGLDPLKRNFKGITPLHFAAMQGSVAIATLLLNSEKVSDIKSYITAEASGVCHETPFYFAAKFNHPNMMEFLLERSVTINSVIKITMSLMSS